MVEQALGSSSGISPQAGPVAVENHTVSDINMRRAAQVIGRRLALIGDELDNRWKEKLPYPRHLNLQAHHNVLIWRAMNR
ncbi:bcl-2-interacting killer isoform X2 [Trichomycterus rosablanca]